MVADSREQPETAPQTGMSRIRDNAAGWVEAAGEWAEKPVAAEDVGRDL